MGARSTRLLLRTTTGLSLCSFRLIPASTRGEGNSAHPINTVGRLKSQIGRSCPPPQQAADRPLDLVENAGGVAACRGHRCFAVGAACPQAATVAWANTSGAGRAPGAVSPRAAEERQTVRPDGRARRHMAVRSSSGSRELRLRTMARIARTDRTKFALRRRKV